MSLALTSRTRAALYESSVVEPSDSSITVSEFESRSGRSSTVESSDSSITASEFKSRTDESSGSTDSTDSNNANETVVPNTRSRTNSNIDTCSTSSCGYSWPVLSLMRGTAELLWHGVGRVVNAGTFIALSNVPASGLRITASVMTGVAAGGCGYRFVASRTDGGACGTALAAAAGLVTGIAAGTATYYGSGYPGLMVAATSVVAFGASHVQHSMENREGSAPLAHTLVPAVVVAVHGASIAVVAYTPGLRAADVGKLGRRTIALLAEAVTIELFKGSTERMAPSVDRSRLSFERKLKFGLIGLLPYAFASVMFSGIFGNLLRAQMKSDEFESYFAPLLVGALASVIKGAVNTAIVRSRGNLSSCASGDDDGVNAAEGLRCPTPGITLEKAALRFAIASARDVIYLSLVDSGLEEIPAACIAYSLYAFFAQHRELMLDMMQGEGWSEPKVVQRPSAEVATA